MDDLICARKTLLFRVTPLLLELKDIANVKTFIFNKEAKKELDTLNRNETPGGEEEKETSYSLPNIPPSLQ